MPTGTWERLPEPRRRAVIEAAEREFSVRGFSGGSLNAIARDAGVSKGSLFQYFDDKVDLFAYVSERTSERIRAAMEQEAAALPWSTDFFGALRGLNAAWVGYFFDHPVDLALTAAANLEPDRTARAAVRSTVAEHYHGMLRPLISLGRQTGQLREDADEPAMLAFLLLLLPHVALAPHVGGLDSVLGLESSSREQAVAGAQRLLDVLEAAFAA